LRIVASSAQTLARLLAHRIACGHWRALHRLVGFEALVQPWLPREARKRLPLAFVDQMVKLLTFSRYIRRIGLSRSHASPASFRSHDGPSICSIGTCLLPRESTHALDFGMIGTFSTSRQNRMADEAPRRASSGQQPEAQRGTASRNGVRETRTARRA